MEHLFVDEVAFLCHNFKYLVFCFSFSMLMKHNDLFLHFIWKVTNRIKLKSLEKVRLIKVPMQ